MGSVKQGAGCDRQWLPDTAERCAQPIMTLWNCCTRNSIVYDRGRLRTELILSSDFGFTLQEHARTNHIIYSRLFPYQWHQRQVTQWAMERGLCSESPSVILSGMMRSVAGLRSQTQPKRAASLNCHHCLVKNCFFYFIGKLLTCLYNNRADDA